MASAFYLGKRFTIDPARLDAALTGAEKHFADYREISSDENHLRVERQRLSAAIRTKIEVGRLSSHFIEPDGNRVIRHPLPEEVRVAEMDREIAKLATRKAAASEAVQAYGRVREAAREHAERVGLMSKQHTLGYIA